VDLLLLGVVTDPYFFKKPNKIKLAERGGFEPPKRLCKALKNMPDVHEIGHQQENHFPKFPPAFCVKITQYSPSMLVQSQA
jgi:hypothetical protein